MGNSNSSKRLERADKTGVLVLQRQMPPLTKIPDKALSITTLRSLDLSHNHITKLGPGVGTFNRKLTTLVLAHNKLTALDDAIGALSKLETLDVRHNALTTLPPSLVGCTRLKKLHVDNNAIAVLPPAIGDLGALTVLTASSNNLARLPDEFGRLGSIVELDLTSNDLEAFPATAGGMKKLRVLKVKGNPKMASLPPTLLTDTPLDRVEVDNHLLGTDGLLAGEGAEAYNERRKALVDKELSSKMGGGELKFST